MKLASNKHTNIFKIQFCPFSCRNTCEKEIKKLFPVLKVKEHTKLNARQKERETEPMLKKAIHFLH